MGDPREKCDPKCARRLVDINFPKMRGVGPTNAKIMFVGEAPGQDEDQQGVPFVGASGQTLNDILKELGIDREKVYITNAVKCATCHANIKPTKPNITKCRPHLLRELIKIKPIVVVALGAVALDALTRRTGITKIQNNVLLERIKYGKRPRRKYLNFKVVPVVHPAYVLRNPSTMKDLQTGLELAVVESASHDIVTQPSKRNRHISVKTPQQIDKLFAILEKEKSFCFDLETTALDARVAKIILIAFSWKIGVGATVQWKNLTDEHRERLSSLLTSSAVKIGHNLKFDIKILNKHGIKVSDPIFDCLPAAALVDENIRDKGLDALVLRYLDMGEYWRDLDRFKEDYISDTQTSVADFSYDKIPLKILAPYASCDADATNRLYWQFKHLLEQDDLYSFYKKYTIPTFWILLEMESRGIRVNRKKLRKLGRKYAKKISKSYQSIYACGDVKRYEKIKLNKISKELFDKFSSSKILQGRYAGEFKKYRKKRLRSATMQEKLRFNPKSTQQLGEVLYGMLKITPTKKTEKGSASTDVSVLETLKNDVELVNLILTHRSLTKFMSTYIKSIYVKSSLDGRVYPGYLQHRTVTGRLSSVDPNFQNIPRDAYDLKSCFMADPGMVIVKADLAQAEFRCWAHCSNDRRMISDIESGLDIHRRTASEVFCIPEEQVTKDQRTAAKSCVFGLMYGRGTRAVAKQFGISEEQANMVRSIFFSKYRDASLWLDQQVTLAKETCRVKTWMGRIRRIPEIRSKDSMVQAEAERQAKNSPIQGLASDMNNHFMVKNIKIARKHGIVCYPMSTVHDANIVQVRKDQVKKMVKVMKHVVATAFPDFRCVMKLDFEIGKTLGTLEALKDG